MSRDGNKVMHVGEVLSNVSIVAYEREVTYRTCCAVVSYASCTGSVISLVRVNLYSPRQSAATVRRWLHRFEAEGCAGLEEAPRSGRPPQVTDAVEAYLRKVVVQSPREFGYARPGWTTALLAKLIRRKYKRGVSEECVRQHLAAAGVVCRRPTWTVKYRAEEQPGYAQKKAGLPGS